MIKFLLNGRPDGAPSYLQIMQNFKLTLEYDGTNYKGFQIQKNANTIQAEIEKAIQKLFHKNIRIVSCGRTDTGVHAKRHVVNFKVATQIKTKNIQSALNRYLPRDISVRKVEKVAASFHSRFDANSKIYEYAILLSSNRSPLLERYTCRYPYLVDSKKMQQALKLLEGRHDFRSFAAKTAKEKNTVRLMYRASLTVKGRRLTIRLEANGFLYNMVRNIAGTVLMVGRGKMTLAFFKKLLQLKDRKQAGPTAPPHGLVLAAVKY